MACLVIDNWTLVFGDLDHATETKGQVVTDIVCTNGISEGRNIIQVEKLEEKELKKILKKLNEEKIKKIDSHKVYTKEDFLDTIER